MEKQKKGLRCNTMGLVLPAKALFLQLAQSPTGLKRKKIGIGSVRCSLVTWCQPKAI